ncbi:MAG: hypothetical protein ACI9CQ_003620, partial [Saprospiraceae bacterium]
DVDPLQSQENEVLFFNAQKDGRDVALNWVTNTDYKNDYFVVERSVDGVNFELLDQIISSGESEGSVNYQLDDDNAFRGINYYRIKEVFYDGTYRYSQMEEVAFDLDVNEFTLFPNPTDKKVFVNLKDFVGNKGTVEIHNALGQKVYSQQFDDIPSHPIAISVAGLSSGMHAVSVKVEDKKIITEMLMISKM